MPDTKDMKGGFESLAIEEPCLHSEDYDDIGKVVRMLWALNTIENVSDIHSDVIHRDDGTISYRVYWTQ